jgi:hypothetical protein
MAYLSLEAPSNLITPARYGEVLAGRLREKGRELKSSLPRGEAVFAAAAREAQNLAGKAKSPGQLLDQLTDFASRKSEAAPDDRLDAWDEVLLALSSEKQRSQVFKQPEALHYIEGLQKFLLRTEVVGKSNSLADIVRTVYRELISGEDKDLRVPATSDAVGQCLITFQGSHRPGDLWHFVTPNYRKTILWVQLKSGDNQAMSRVVSEVQKYLASHPAPYGIKARWFGLTYINVVWQKRMVSGMLQAFLGSFIAVFLMMTLLYRSALWGLLAMIPLTITIGLIYGAIGLAGKDYDMPVAVLSSLSLGLAVDYAIHFLTRSRNLYACYGSWGRALGAVFAEPARAITRNVIVIGVGFLPLILAPLVPYQTVGFFIAAILITAGAATLLILPALITILEPYVFPRTKPYCVTCDHITCTVSAVALVALVAVNIHQFLALSWNPLAWWSLGIMAVLAATCFLTSRRPKCKLPFKETEALEDETGTKTDS